MYNDDFEIRLGSSGSGLDGLSSDAVISNADTKYSVAEVLSDVTGDGYRDLAVTHSRLTVYEPYLGWLTYAGIVAILPGAANLPVATAIESTGTRFLPDSGSDYLGITVAGSDVDGDGVGDVLYTASLEGPRLFYGPITPGAHLIAQADAHFTMFNSYNYAGVSGVGDTNADGYEDFLVGLMDDGDGPVYLFTGAPN